MTEIWKPIPGFHYYEASDEGRIRSLVRPGTGKRKTYGGGILSAHVNKHNGYEYVGLCVDGVAVTRRVHVLVLATHRGPRPDGMQGRHLDGRKTNNRLVNLA